MCANMFTFHKNERLCSQKLIDALFISGKKLMAFPYSVRWMECPKGTLPEGVRAQVLIGTSKKKFHHAVDRNQVKRLSRECYRLHKPQLLEALIQTDKEIILSINYIHNEIFDFSVLQHKFDKLTTTLLAALSTPLAEEH